VQAATVTSWISVEGLNGVGKTYLIHALASRLGPGGLVLDELTDSGDNTSAALIGTLAANGDTFLRTGHPLTETFILAALKVREYEHVISSPTAPRWVLEDRGMDTVAVYQAAILSGGPQLADKIAAITSPWRPDPDLTVLLLDDFDTCMDRFGARLGHPIDTGDRDVLTAVADLYAHRAAADPDRWRICSRTDRPNGVVLDELETWCQHAIDLCEVSTDAA
jgi:dTMP kinase